jgi:putative flippase GtrA
MLAASYRQKFLFLFAGGVGFSTYYLLSNLLFYGFKVPEVQAALAAMVVSVFPTYYLQKRFTFRSLASNARTLPRYLALQVVNAGVIGGSTFLLKNLQLPQLIVFGIAGLVGTVVSYVVQRRYVFPAS